MKIKNDMNENLKKMDNEFEGNYYSRTGKNI